MTAPLLRTARICSLVLPLMYPLAGAPLQADAYALQVDSGGTLLTNLEYYAREEADSNDVSVHAKRNLNGQSYVGVGQDRQ